ncbi:MAG: fumarate hydratase [Deltaproteobacteria bacterium]|nr:fumarate hydratase [Deltaproteobacteria bacterium]
MKEIKATEITKVISTLCQEANFGLGEDVLFALKKALKTEESPLGKEVLTQLIENAGVAKDERIALCQDCGTAAVFLEIGQDIHISGGDLYAAIEEGVRQGYDEGCLRKAIVKQPFSERINTRDNTPAVIHAEIVPGDKLKITVMPKGGGAENMSQLAMLLPNQGSQGIIELVARVVDEAGGNACPPLIIGVGVGGTADKAMLLAKKALLRTVAEPNADPEVAKLEKDILAGVNELGIGPMGYGGGTTALAVHALVMPAHIGSLPVAVNLQCHSARHKEAIL